MAFPTNTFTAADLASFIPEVWGERINDFFREDLVMADFFTDRSDEVVSGGDTLYTPGLTQMAASAKSNATAVTLVSPTETSVTLSVNTWKEVSFAIEDKEAAQFKRSYAVQERYAKNAAYSIAEDLENAIAAKFTGFSNSVGSNASGITDTLVRNAIGTLRSNIKSEFRTGDIAFFLHPIVFYGQVQALDKFSLAVNSPVNDPTAKMPEGMLYGIPVYITTNIVLNTDLYENALAHKDAIHFATAALPVQSPNTVVGKYGVRVQSNYIPDYLSTITTADILYGVVENRDAAGVLIKTDVDYD